MKKNKFLQLDKKILTARGRQASERLEDGKVIPLTIKEVLISLLPLADRKGRQAVTAWDLVLKIKNCKGSKMEFSDEEFGFIKKVVEENFRAKGANGEVVSYYLPFVTAQILSEMEKQMR